MNLKNIGIRSSLTLLSTSLIGLAASAAGLSPQVLPAADPAPASRAAPDPAAVAAPSRARAVAGYGRLPISFEPNVGQSAASVKYTARGQGFSMALTDNSALLNLRGGKDDKAASLRLSLIGSAANPALHAEDKQASVSNYFIGRDASQWHKGVANYGAVRYSAVYPGIDWKVYGNPQQFEYDLIVAAKADPAQIKLKLDGADSVSLDASGDLLVQVNGKTLRQLKPVVYQLDAKGNKQSVAAEYTLDAEHRQIAFNLADYDHGRELVIDPSFVYSSYVGGSYADSPLAVAVDDFGDAYLAGVALSSDFPTSAAMDSTLAGGGDGFITKLNPSGSTRLFSTYFGGSGYDLIKGIALDSAGNAYVTGQTQSPDLPVVNAFQATYGGATDAFIAKISANGSALLYSTYLGGSDYEQSNAIAVDGAGNAYVTGAVLSTNFPTANAFQSQIAPRPDGEAPEDAFVTKLNAAGNALVYSTYLGGAYIDQGNGIAVDAAGDAVITGYTFSENFPIVNALQAVPKPRVNFANLLIAFVTKLTPSGNAAIYSTFLGGSTYEVGNAVAVDSAGNAYVTGITGSTDFPTVNAARPTFGGYYDAFVSKLNPGGSALVYSTYLGGTYNPGRETTEGRAIAVDANGQAYVTGSTGFADFPVVDPLQATFHPANVADGYDSDAFLTQFSSAGSTILFSSYLGGTGRDTAYAIAVGGDGGVYVGGETRSRDFPTFNPLQDANLTTVGGDNATGFISKIAFQPPVPKVSLSLTNPIISESGTSTQVVATLDFAVTRKVTVSLAGTGVSTHGRNYARSSNLIVIPAGSLRGSIQIAGVDDQVYEGNQLLPVRINTVVNAAIGSPSEVDVLLTDNDAQPAVSLSLGATSISEHGGSTTLTATLTTPIAKTTTVTIKPSGSARYKRDYGLSSTTISIPAGRTSASVTVTGIDDAMVEPTETASFGINTVAPNYVGLGGPVSLDITSDD